MMVATNVVGVAVVVQQKELGMCTSAATTTTAMIMMAPAVKRLVLVPSPLLGHTPVCVSGLPVGCLLCTCRCPCRSRRGPCRCRSSPRRVACCVCCVVCSYVPIAVAIATCGHSHIEFHEVLQDMKRVLSCKTS